MCYWQSFISGRGCQYGKDCKFSHDTAEFLANKPADIEGTCPFVLSVKKLKSMIKKHTTGTKQIPPRGYWLGMHGCTPPRLSHRIRPHLLW